MGLRHRSRDVAIEIRHIVLRYYRHMSQSSTPCEPAVLEHLNDAKSKLADVLPPQADKILRAFQHVQIALEFSSMEGGSDRTLDECREALRALDEIDHRDQLSAQINDAIAIARIKITDAATRLDTGA